MMQYVVFKHGDKELAAYTLFGTFAGEAEATAQLLAAERNIPRDEITISIQDRRSRK
ncbi:MAG: hypothetical protein LUD19_03315 [Clostridia bacterium]|nr:hypothetical protein [Clostridia bacterium]